MNKTCILIMFVLIQGCTINGTYSLKDDAERTVRGNAEYEHILEAESYSSASECVEKWRLDKIKREYNLPNGNFVHVYPVRCGCLVHWEIERTTKKVIGYKFEGESCPK